MLTVPVNLLAVVISIYILKSSCHIVQLQLTNCMSATSQNGVGDGGYVPRCVCFGFHPCLILSSCLQLASSVDLFLPSSPWLPSPPSLRAAIAFEILGSLWDAGIPWAPFQGRVKTPGGFQLLLLLRRISLIRAHRILDP